MGEVLVLGGTGWLGRAVVEALLRDGAAVTSLARGITGLPPAGARFVAVDRTEPDAYAAVADRTWDAVLELSYEPVLVNGALEALADRAGHWTLVSSVSVYADNDDPSADESAAVVEPVELTEYAQAKVAAERATAAALGERALIARPGLIAGPGDPSDRFGYWTARFAHAGAGPVLAPVPEGRWGQVVDVADLARWLAEAGTRGVVGTYNVTGLSRPLAEVLEVAAEVAGFTGELVQVPDQWLVDHDVRHWAGPRSLPLWLPAADAAHAQRDATAFRAAGGTLRPLRETTERVLTDDRHRGLDRCRRSGLTRAEELELIERYTADAR